MTGKDMTFLCMIKHCNQMLLGKEKAYLGYKSIIKGSQYRNSNTNWGRNHQRALPAGFFPRDLLSYHSYTVQYHLPAQCCTCPQWDTLPLLINNKENVPQTCLQANLMEEVLQLIFIRPRYILASVKLTN